jgi:hypothetical protein
VPLRAELLRGLDALAATAAGTLAGVLADSGFALRDPLMSTAYRLLEPLFGLFGANVTGQLVFVEFVQRIPGVLLVGLVVGLALKYVRYQWLLSASVVVWPATLFAAAVYESPAGGSNLLPDLVLYCLQYSLLILMIRLAHAAGRPYVSAN